MTSGYESYFGLTERPFSLTPDPRFYFKSRSHGRAIETLIFALRRRERLLLVTGDLGVGKTVLCRAQVEQLRRKGPTSFVRSPLLTAGGLFRLLLEDFGAAPPPAVASDDATPQELRDRLVAFLRGLRGHRDVAVAVVDEGHTTPTTIVEHLLALAALEPNGDPVLQVVLAGQPTRTDAGALGIPAIDERVVTRTRLLPLSREECNAYLSHRLRIAGAEGVRFTARGSDVLHGLSGGVPRLVNLLAERALQEAEVDGVREIDSSTIASAASALEILLARPRRFRWFSKRVS